MYYATKERMIDLFGEDNLVMLTDGVDEIDDAKLDAAIEAAEAEVNGYLQGVVSLPLERVPNALRLHACNVAYWYLHGDNPTDGATARYRAATRFLERVQDGKAGLGLDDLDEPVKREGGGVQTSGSDRVMTTDRLKGYAD